MSRSHETVTLRFLLQSLPPTTPFLFKKEGNTCWALYLRISLGLGAGLQLTSHNVWKRLVLQTVQVSHQACETFSMQA